MTRLSRFASGARGGHGFDGGIVPGGRSGRRRIRGGAHQDRIKTVRAARATAAAGRQCGPGGRQPARAGRRHSRSASTQPQPTPTIHASVKPGPAGPAAEAGAPKPGCGLLLTAAGLPILAKLAKLLFMSTMNVSLPAAMKAFIDEQVERKGYGSSSEYIRDLLRREQDREQLRGLLLEGLNSGPGRSADAAFFSELRERIRLRAAQGPAARRAAKSRASGAC